MNNGICAVTGGKGHVGFALVKELAARGCKIKLLLRSDSKVFDGIDCVKIMGDVCDTESLIKTFEGCETVYHVAGIVDITGTKDKEVWEVNYEATKKVVDACKKTGVKNLVFVSSVDALIPSHGSEEITEVSEFDPDAVEGAYAKSKAAASQYVLDNADDNLKVCVVHPSACIGPYDNNGTSSMGTVIKFFAKGLFPITFGFGTSNFIDVRDVAKGIVAAAEKGRNGECYFLCSKVCTLDYFIGALAQASGKKHPKIVLSENFVFKIIPVCEKVLDIAKIPPMINEYSIRKVLENFNFSNEKATKELGFSTRPLVETLRDNIAWLKENGKI